MDRVVFLDVDGVLNTANDRRINADMVKRLASFAMKPEIKIILHSGWRFWFDDRMEPKRKEAETLRDALLNTGLILHGKTPDLSDDEIKRTKMFSKVKAAEILQWLKNYVEVKYWVVLDDLDLHNEVVNSHQVRPDSKIGLSEADVKKAEIIISHTFPKWTL